MGEYIYRATSRRVLCSDGKEANLAKYAYKPYRGWSDWDRKQNNLMALSSGIYASERLADEGKLTDRIVICDDDYSFSPDGPVYANPARMPHFYDDRNFGHPDRMPVIKDVKAVSHVKPQRKPKAKADAAV